MAFEYGVQHGGGDGEHNPKDCIIQSSADKSGCDGQYYNVDLYIKKHGRQWIYKYIEIVMTHNFHIMTEIAIQILYYLDLNFIHKYVVLIAQQLCPMYVTVVFVEAMVVVDGRATSMTHNLQTKTFTLAIQVQDNTCYYKIIEVIFRTICTQRND